MLSYNGGPLLRVPFIILNTVMTNIATTPPNQPAKKDEQSRYEENKRKEALTATMAWYLPTYRVSRYMS